MKKSLLLFTILLFSALACLAQNNESLGDKAMEQGNYEKAVEYYMAEMSKNPTDALVRKLNKAVILKYEFCSIDTAAKHHSYWEMDLHIANVLMIDPNNRFVENKGDLVYKEKPNTSIPPTTLPRLRLPLRGILFGHSTTTKTTTKVRHHTTT